MNKHVQIMNSHFPSFVVQNDEKQQITPKTRFIRAFFFAAGTGKPAFPH